jgi:hypothetical protein
MIALNKSLLAVVINLAVAPPLPLVLLHLFPNLNTYFVWLFSAWGGMYCQLVVSLCGHLLFIYDHYLSLGSSILLNVTFPFEFINE